MLLKGVNLDEQTVTVCSITPQAIALDKWTLSNDYDTPWCYTFPDGYCLEPFSEVTVWLAPAANGFDGNMESALHLLWRTEENEMRQRRVMSQSHDIALKDPSGRVHARMNCTEINFSDGYYLNPQYFTQTEERAAALLEYKKQQQAKDELRSMAAIDIQTVLRVPLAREYVRLYKKYQNRAVAVVSIQTVLRTVMVQQRVLALKKIRRVHDEKRLAVEKRADAAVEIQAVLRTLCTPQHSSESLGRAMLHHSAAVDIQAICRSLYAQRITAVAKQLKFGTLKNEPKDDKFQFVTNLFDKVGDKMATVGDSIGNNIAKVNDLAQETPKERELQNRLTEVEAELQSVRKQLAESEARASCDNSADNSQKENTATEVEALLLSTQQQLQKLKDETSKTNAEMTQKISELEGALNESREAAEEAKSQLVGANAKLYFKNSKLAQIEDELREAKEHIDFLEGAEGSEGPAELESELRLQMDFDSVPEGSEARAQLAEDFVSDISESLGVPASDVEIQGFTPTLTLTLTIGSQSSTCYCHLQILSSTSSRLLTLTLTLGYTRGSVKVQFKIKESPRTEGTVLDEEGTPIPTPRTPRIDEVMADFKKQAQDPASALFSGKTTSCADPEHAANAAQEAEKHLNQQKQELSKMHGTIKKLRSDLAAEKKKNLQSSITLQAADETEEQLDQSQAECEELKEKLAACQEECKNLKDQVRDLQNDPAKASQIENINSNEEVSEDTCEQLRSQLAALGVQLEASEQNVETANQELGVIQDKLQAEEENLKQAQLENESLTSESNTLSESLMSAESKLKETEETLMSAESKLKETEESLMTSESKFEKTAELLATSESDLSETEKAMAALQNDYDSLRLQHTETTAELENTKAQSVHAATEHTVLTKANKDICEQQRSLLDTERLRVEEANAAILGREKLAREATVEVAEFKRQAQQAVQDREASIADYVELQKRFVAAEATVHRERNIYNESKEILAATERSLQEREGKISDLKAAVAMEQRLATELRAQILSASDQVHDLNEEVVALTAQLQQKTNEVNDLGQQLDLAKNTAIQLQSRLEDDGSKKSYDELIVDDSQLEVLREERNSERIRADRAEVECLAHEAATKDTQRQLQETEARVQRLREELVASQQRIDSSAEDMSVLQKDCDFARLERDQIKVSYLEAQGTLSMYETREKDALLLQRMEELEGLNSQLQNDLLIAKHEYEESRSQKATQAHQADSFRKELQLWQEGMTKGTATLREQAKASLEEERTRRSALGMQLEEYKIDNDKKQRQMEKLQAQVDRSKEVLARFDATQEQLVQEQANCQQLTAHVSELLLKVETNSSLQQRCEEQETRLAQQDESITFAKNVVGGLEMECESWLTSAIFNKMNAEIQNQCERIIQLESEHGQAERFQSELQDCQQELQMEQQKVDKLQAEIVTHKSDLENVRTELQQSVEAASDAQHATLQVQSELEDERLRSTRLSTELESKRCNELIQLIQDQTTQMDELRDIIAHTGPVQIEQLTKEALEQSSKYTALENKLKDVQFRLEVAEAQNEKDQANYKALDLQFSAQQRDLESKQEVLQLAQDKAESVTAEFTEKRQQLAETSRLLETEQSRSVRFEQELELRIGTEVVDGLRDELEGQREEASSLRLEVSSLKRQISQQGKSGSNDQQGADREENVFLKNQIQQLKDAETRSSAEISALGATKREQTSQLRHEQARTHELQTTVSRQEEDWKDATSKMAELTFQFETSEQKIESLQKELSLSRSAQVIRSLREERDDLASRMFEGVAAIAEVTRLENELNVVKQQLAKLADPINGLQARLEQSERMKQKGDEEIATLHTKIATLEEGLRSANEEYDESEQKRWDTKAKLSEASEKLDQAVSESIEAKSMARFDAMSRQTIENELQQFQDNHNVDGSVTAQLRKELEEERSKNIEPSIVQGHADHAKAELNRVQHELNEVEKLLEEKTTALNEEKKQSLLVQTNVADSATVITNLQSQLSELQIQYDAVCATETNAAEDQAKAEELQTKLDELIKEKEATDQRIQNYVDELAGWGASVETNAEIVLELRTEIESSNKRLQVLGGIEAKAAALEAELAGMLDQGELVELRKSLQAQEELVLELREETARQAGELTIALDSKEVVEAAVQTLQESLAATQEELKAAAAQLEPLTSALETAQSQLKETQGKVASLMEQRTEAKDAISAGERIIQHLKQELMQHEAMYATQIETMKSGHSKELELSFNITKEAKQDISLRDSEIEQQKTKIIALQEQVSSLEGDLSLEKKQSQRVQTDLTVCSGDKMTLESQLSELQTQYCESKANEEKASGQAKSLSEEVTALKESFQLHKTQVDDLTHELREERQTVHDLRTQVLRAETIKTVLDQLKPAMAQVKQEKEELGAQVFTGMERESGLKEQINSAQKVAAEWKLQREAVLEEEAKKDSQIENLTKQLAEQQEAWRVREDKLKKLLDEQRELALTSDVALRKSEASCETLTAELRDTNVKLETIQPELDNAHLKIKVLTAELEAKVIDFELKIQEAQQQVLQKIGEAFTVQRLCYSELAQATQDKNQAVEKMLAARMELAKLREEGLYMAEEVREKLGLPSAAEQVQMENLKDDLEKLTQEKLDLQESLAEYKMKYEELCSLTPQQVSEGVWTLHHQPVQSSSEFPTSSESTDSATNKVPPLDLTSHEKQDQITAHVKEKMFERALNHAQKTAEEVGGTIEVEQFRKEWEENEGLMVDLQDEIAEQLTGDIGHSARNRFENPDEYQDFERLAALYVKWKARFALEQTLRKDCEVEIEALNMKYNADAYARSLLTYESLQSVACTRDFRNLLQYNFVGITGKDAFDIPVVVFAAANVPKNKFSLDWYMQYLVYMLDDLVDDPYHIVYVNSSDGDCDPCEFDSAWLEKGLQVLPAKYKKNLQNIFVLHPTFWFKVEVQTALDSKLEKKVRYADTIEDLFKQLGRRGTVLPGYAYDAEGSLHTSRQLLVRAKQQSWDNTMLELEQKSKQKLLERNRNTLDFLAFEKQRFIREELYADAELVKDEMEALRQEIAALDSELELDAVTVTTQP